MTACAYVRLPVDVNDPDPDRPVRCVLIADTLASAKAPVPLPFLPSSGLVEDMTARHTTSVMRKIYIMDDAAVAFAGNEGAVRSVFSYLPAWLKEWTEENPDHPMEHYAGKLAHIAATPSLKSVGGFAVVRTPRGTSWGGAGDLQTELRHFGTCLATGTGAKDLTKFFSQHDIFFEQIIEARKAYDLPPLTDEEKIAWLVNALNGRKFMREIAVGSENYWGAYLEHAMLQIDGWKFGPGTLHYLINYRTEGGMYYLDLLRIVAYDAYLIGGSIVTARPDDGWLIFSIDRIDEDLQDAHLKQWKGWKPSDVFVTAMVNGNPDQLVQVRLTEEQKAHCLFEIIGDDGLECGWVDHIPDGLPQFIMRSAMEMAPR